MLQLNVIKYAESAPKLFFLQLHDYVHIISHTFAHAVFFYNYSNT